MKITCALRSTIMPPLPIDTMDFHHSESPFPLRLLDGRIYSSPAEVNKEEGEDDA